MSELLRRSTVTADYQVCPSPVPDEQTGYSLGGDIYTVVLPTTRENLVATSIQSSQVIHFIARMFATFPSNKRDSLLCSVSNEIEKGNQDTTNVFGALVTASDSLNFKERLAYVVTHSKIIEILKTPGSREIVQSMLTSPGQFTFQLGIVFSKVDPSYYSDSVAELLSVHKTSHDIEIKTSYADWDLCATSENKLNTAISAHTAVVIHDDGEPLFMLKVNGKMTAICLQNTVTPSGLMFVKGNWYSPVDSDYRSFLKNSFDEGYGQIPLQKSTWSLMREARVPKGSDIKDWLQVVDNSVAHIPQKYADIYVQLAGRSASRMQYRTRTAEGF